MLEITTCGPCKLGMIPERHTLEGLIARWKLEGLTVRIVTKLLIQSSHCIIERDSRVLLMLTPKHRREIKSWALRNILARVVSPSKAKTHANLTLTCIHHPSCLTLRVELHPTQGLLQLLVHNHLLLVKKALPIRHVSLILAKQGGIQTLQLVSHVHGVHISYSHWVLHVLRKIVFPPLSLVDLISSLLQQLIT